MVFEAFSLFFLPSSCLSLTLLLSFDLGHAFHTWWFNLGFLIYILLMYHHEPFFDLIISILFSILHFYFNPKGGMNTLLSFIVCKLDSKSTHLFLPSLGQMIVVPGASQCIIFHFLGVDICLFPLYIFHEFYIFWKLFGNTYNYKTHSSILCSRHCKTPDDMLREQELDA